MDASNQTNFPYFDRCDKIFLTSGVDRSIGRAKQSDPKIRIQLIERGCTLNR